MAKGKGTGSGAGGKGTEGRKPSILRLVGPEDTAPETDGKAGPADPPSQTGGQPGFSDPGQDDDDTHYGEVIEPGRKPKTRGPIIAALGVTMKEEGFCQGVAMGLSQSEAYRQSHDAEGMLPQSIWAQAVKIASRERVQTRIDQIIAEKRGHALHDRRRALTWSLNRLQQEAETAETDGARVAAVSLIMRHHALLTDKIETEAVQSKDAKEVEDAIRLRLSRLLGKAG